MSASGPKQTWAIASPMSAFGGKADMATCGCPLLRSLLGVKRTCLFAMYMSAYDPKRTSAGQGRRDELLGGSASAFINKPLIYFPDKPLNTLANFLHSLSKI
jgi:hypothetical protein